MAAPHALDHDLVAWLLDSDAAVRWQVMRDLLDEPDDVWQSERARVETTGWGGELLAAQDDDGLWAGGAFVPAGFTSQLWQQEGQPWTATAFALNDLRSWGLDPDSEAAQRTVRSVGEHARWDAGGQRFWDGEVEECINGRTLADGVYFGVDMNGLVARLVADQQPDGGWNCERVNGSVRSSFDSTINVLEGLLAHERATGGTPESIAARHGGEEFLLDRELFRRKTTGEPADPDYLTLLHPPRWRYSVLRALDYMRARAVMTDESVDARLGAALDVLRARQLSDGRWPVDGRPGGRQWFEVDDGPGTPSRWVTLVALRIVRWADAS